MKVENININGEIVPQLAVEMEGDGACLFRALSFLMYGTQENAFATRQEVVVYVVEHWDEFSIMSHDINGDNYSSAEQYFADMIKRNTYGGLCELIAAGRIYNFVFQVYRNGELYVEVGTQGRPIKRLRFKNNLSDGHFDVYLPYEEFNPMVVLNVVELRSNQPGLNEPKAKKNKNSEALDVVPPICSSESESAVSADLSLEMSTSSVRKTKKRRARFTDKTRKMQIHRNQKKYVQNNPVPHRNATANYQRKNPEVHRKSVVVYQEKHPEVHRESVATYQEKHPEVHRESVAAYQKKHPEVHKKYVATYQENHPEVHRKSSGTYQEKHPEVHRKSVAAYQEKHPEVHRAAQTRYNTNVTTRPWNTKCQSAMSYQPEIDYECDKLVAIGNMSQKCQWCNALKWKDETPGLCCGSGKVQLNSLSKPPEPLHSLLMDLHPDHKHFMANVRKYNNCFQMSSFGGKQVGGDGFTPTFKVQGQVYHLAGSLLPEPGKAAQFLQIYFVGEDEREANLRLANYPHLKPNIVKQLQKLLHEVNPYIRDLKCVIDKVPASCDTFKVVIHAEKNPQGAHRGRYNSPAVNEVALVLLDQQFEQRDIILESRSSQLQRISEFHRSYDALQYPLMFSHGEDGYSIGISQRDPNTKLPLKKTVSAASFYSYHIMIREGEENYLLYFGALFSQYIVDQYAKIETERLNFIRYNQAKLRAESYIHLKDAIGQQDVEANQLGQIVVLPSSFTGGPRYMHERTQDAMTYVRHYGRPDLFITFTCNPKWEEITKLLHPNQKSYDRHDLIARIFRLKVKKMMDLINKGKIFGEVRCYMYSVEYQKRGLPHIHILLWLIEHISADMIDNIICAEIPDPDADPKLYQIIRSNMIHGPCGNFNNKSPCMKDSVCSKRFPRPLLSETQTGDDGYPQYRRRSPGDGGFTVHINGVELDNRWVVPYNAVLLRTFNAHINVEYCNSVKSIKYICKYVNKGSDQATVTLEDSKDEVKMYESGRYISSAEAVWRILGFPIHERYPTVIHLAVHLENGQRVYFNPSNLADRVSSPPKTTLTSFFELCRFDDFAKTLLYCEVPAYYVWNNNKFERRKRGANVDGWPGVKKEHALGRVYTVHPNNTECYHLRLLLHEVRGPTSFESLRTINGVVQPTFKSACKALGLLEDDQHWRTTLQEAALCQSPFMMRELFTILLVFCQVADPVSLWNEFRENLSEDFKRQIERQAACDVNSLMDEIFNRCLLEIETACLALGGCAIEGYGLPKPTRSEGFNNELGVYINELNYDVPTLQRFVNTNEDCLTDEQKLIYNKIIANINTNDGKIFFLDAPGGTGKTYLINLILAKIRSNRGIAIAVASSGIAATLLEGGRTAHSALKLPLNLSISETPICNIPKQSNLAKVLRKAEIIIWDESTMAHKKCFEALNRTLQDLRDNNSLMGGLTLLLAGDFRQTLPVVPRGTRADEIKACLKRSVLWPSIEILNLTKNMRVLLKGDINAGNFSNILLKIGNGIYPEKDGLINLPENLCTVVTTVPELIDKVYPNIARIQHKPIEWLHERAILSPTNEHAALINDVLLNSFEGEEMIYKSVDTVIHTEDAVHYPVEFLNTINPAGLPYHSLRLRVGAPVMLLRNLKPPKLCNGTRLQVRVLHRNIVEGIILTGSAKGETVFIPRIPLIPNDLPFEFRRLQFPLKVCFAMTINKSQGQTLALAGVDLRQPCFSHGQLYVACSRVSSPSSLVILAPPSRTTRNVVYKEIL